MTCFLLFHDVVGYFIFYFYLFIFINKLINLFIFGCVGSSLLRMGISLVVVSGGYSAVCGLLIAGASFVVEHGL